ncbi:hypothetical protein K438DRAFT_1975938 [Mycena galopus ATCC 62051]|nr:hypothetical protein K438DRAFT_1975938 [Mycena galopus ATCC 62051]
MPSSQTVLTRIFPQMPWRKSHAVSDMTDLARNQILTAIRRMPPPDACDALLNIRPYLEQPGVVYAHIRINWNVLANPPTIPDDEQLDYLDLKVGQTTDIDARRAAYAKCEGEEILWCFYYATDHPKLIERLTHLTLAYIGAKRVPYPCQGCKVCHREHFSEGCAVLELVAATIEYWIRKIGEVPSCARGLAVNVGGAYVLTLNATGCGNNTPFTTLCLYPLAQHCPRLRFVAISVRTPFGPNLHVLRPSSHQLTALSIAHSPLASHNARYTALLLRTIFPKLRRIEHPSHPAIFSKPWADVISLLRGPPLIGPAVPPFFSPYYVYFVTSMFPFLSQLL